MFKQEFEVETNGLLYFFRFYTPTALSLIPKNHICLRILVYSYVLWHFESFFFFLLEPLSCVEKNPNACVMESDTKGV